MTFRLPRFAAALFASTTLTVATAGAAESLTFSRVSTLPAYLTLPAGVDPATKTAAEIVTATKDGQTLIYTDSPGKAVVFVDAADPLSPKPLRRVDLGGEPTSVTASAKTALVGVNTSESYVRPSGHVAVVDLGTGRITARCDVKGQPDSVAISPDGRFLAVAVENERDEKLNDGAMPQDPAGHVAIFRLNTNGMPQACKAATIVPMTGLSAIAPTDPEPEFVSINSDNIAVVTLQENNHIALIDLAKGKVINHFSAGTVSLSGIPTAKARLLDATGSITDLPREPDGVTWLDTERFITANEGDYKGGTRGFTIWNTKGDVLYDSGTVMEYLGLAHGHYPAKRASKKGTEPEGVAVGTFGAERLIFVNSERGNFVAVFADTGAAPEFRQFLPTGVAPEGVLAIPSRGLFVTANEADSAEDGVRASLSLFRIGAGAADYPSVVSAKDPNTGAPIGWGALSGLAADPKDPSRVYAVSDSFYDSARIFTLDVSARPARVIAATPLHGVEGPLDLEGIAVRRDGGFWVVSEGNPKKSMDNRLLQVAPDGTIRQDIRLPKVIADAADRFGLEGVTEDRTADGKTRVVIAVQREWKDDPKGLVKLAVYTPETGAWGFVHYPLTAAGKGSWTGLSEITALGDDRFLIIERDNKGGPDAALKQVTLVSLKGITPAPAGSTLPVVTKTVVANLLPQLAATKGWTLDKVEGLTVTAAGQVIALTDNDGVDDATGETRLLDLGPLSGLVK